MNGIIALLPPRARSNMMAFPETDAVATRRRQSVRRPHGYSAGKAQSVTNTTDERPAGCVVVFCVGRGVQYCDDGVFQMITLYYEMLSEHHNFSPYRSA